MGIWRSTANNWPWKRFVLGTQLAIALLVCGSSLVHAEEEPFGVLDVEDPGVGEEKRSGGRPFQFIPEDVNFAGFGGEKRGGGRNFQPLDKRGGGHSFRFTEEKRGGGRHFQSFANEDYKRAGGRAFVPMDNDKRGGGRSFQMNAEDKRAGGRNFQFDSKRAGGRNFQSFASDEPMTEDKRGGGRAFNPLENKRGGGRAFSSLEDKRGGGRAFQALSEDKRGGGHAFRFSDDSSAYKRGGGRSFTPFISNFHYWPTDKRAGARPFFGDLGLKRAGGRYFSRHFNGLDDASLGFQKRGGARPMAPMQKRAGGRAFFGDVFGDVVAPYQSRRFYPEYMKKAPYLFDDTSIKFGTSSQVHNNNFLSELKRTQPEQQPTYWSEEEEEKRAGGRTFPIDDEDSKEKRMLADMSRY